MAVLCMRSTKYAILPPICGRIAKISASYMKSGSRNTMLTSDFWPEMEIWPFRACAIKIRNKPLFMAESPKFSRLLGNWGRGTRSWRQVLDRKWTNGRFAHAQYKIRYITLIYDGIAEIPASYGKSGSRNTTVTSDFRLEMEIWPFRACAVKNLSLIHIWRCRRSTLCRSRWSPYH